MAKKILIITEEQSNRIADKLLNEEKVFTDFDKNWDYKVVGNMWHTTKKGANDWRSLEKFPVAIKRLNAKYNPQSTTTTPSPQRGNKPSPVTQGIPFKNSTEGNNFRGWFIRNTP